MSERKLLTIEAVADYLDIGASTLRAMLKRGEIAAYKVGGQWRFAEQHIQEYLDKRESGSAAASPHVPRARVMASRPDGKPPQWV